MEKCGSEFRCGVTWSVTIVHVFKKSLFPFTFYFSESFWFILPISSSIISLPSFTFPLLTLSYSFFSYHSFISNFPWHLYCFYYYVFVLFCHVYSFHFAFHTLAIPTSSTIFGYIHLFFFSVIFVVLLYSLSGIFHTSSLPSASDSMSM